MRCWRGSSSFFHGGRGQACLWSAWPTPDLRRSGLAALRPPAAARPPAAGDALPSPPAAAATSTSARSTSAADLADWERAAIDGYPLPELHDAPTGAFAAPALLDDERLRFFVGRDGARPVAAGVSFVSHGIASLAFGATLPAPAGAGSGAGSPSSASGPRPSVWTTGVFSDFSRPGAEALGFVPILRLTLWILDRP